MYRFKIIFSLLLLVCSLQADLNSAYAQAIQSIKRVSLSPESNEQGISYSYDPNIDGEGRYVAFTSTSDNFAADGKVEGELHEHVYIRDTLTGTTTQLDITSGGKTGSPSASFNPNIRVFRSSLHPNLSRDGKYVVFTSPASDISPDGAGEQFGAWAYIKNLETGAIQRIPYATAGDSTKAEYPTYLAINGDGSKVAITSIISEVTDSTCATCVWELTVYDRNSNTTALINTGVTGNKFNPKMSDDGRFIVFENQVGDFTGPTYAYLYDLQLSQLTQLNDGNTSLSPAISGDGAYIAYSDSSVIPTRIKLRNRESGSEILISGGLGGVEPDGISEFASLNNDGRYVAFLSTASNLVKEDTNNTDDIFVYDRVTAETTLVSVQGSCEGISTTEDFNTGPPSISADGKTITFTVLERLIPATRKNSDGTTELADTNSFDDVYVAKLDYDAEPDVFKKNLTPASPFVSINCKGSEARLQIEDILTAKPGASSSGKVKTNAIRKVTREITISKVENGRQQVRKRIVAKRNTTTVPRLPPGNYVAQVQARAVLKNGSIVRSKQSKPTKFVITK